MSNATHLIGDKQGLLILVSDRSGTIEAIQDGRLSMPLREFSEPDFVTKSQPTTLRHLPTDLSADMDLFGRHDVLDLSSPFAKKTIEVSQGRIFGGIIRIKFEEVLSPFQWGIDCSAESNLTGHWLLNVDMGAPFTIDCLVFHAETQEPLKEVCRNPLTFSINFPTYIILTIRARKLFEEACVLTDDWQMGAVLSSLFHDPKRYLPILPVTLVPQFFAERQLISLRQCLWNQEPRRIILANVPKEIESKILSGIPNLGIVEHYQNLEDIYRIIPASNPVICSPKEMIKGLITAKHMGVGLVLEKGHESNTYPEYNHEPHDVVLVEGPSLSSVVGVNYAYFRGAEIIDVGEIKPSRVDWFNQKCGVIDDFVIHIANLYDQLSLRDGEKVKKWFLFSPVFQPNSYMHKQKFHEESPSVELNKRIRDLTEKLNACIQGMRRVTQQIVGTINDRWASVTAFTEGVPYTIGLDLPCGLIPNSIASYYVFDEIHNEMQKMNPTVSLLVIDPGFFPQSEVGSVVSQSLNKRLSSTVIYKEEATKDVIHSYLKFFPYDFLLLVTHGDRTSGSIQLYGKESFSQADLVYLTEMSNLKRPLVFNNACSSWYAVGHNFLWFGARAYVGTLWIVRTDSATEIAENFFRNLFEMPSAQSLFKAKSVTSKNDSITSNAYIFIGSALSRFQALEGPASDLQKAIDLLNEYDYNRVGNVTLTPPQDLLQHRILDRLDYIYQILAQKVLRKAPLLKPYIDVRQAHWLSQLDDLRISYSNHSPRELLENALKVNRFNLDSIEKDVTLDKYDKELVRQILHRNLPICLGNLGVEYLREGNESKATDYFSQALGLFEKSSDFIGIGDCYTNWGNTLRRVQPKESVDKLQIARSYYLAAGHHLKTMIVDLMLGDLAADAEDWTTAKNHYMTAKKTAITMGDYQKEVIATNKILRAQIALGEIKPRR